MNSKKKNRPSVAARWQAARSHLRAPSSSEDSSEDSSSAQRSTRPLPEAAAGDPGGVCVTEKVGDPGEHGGGGGEVGAYVGEAGVYVGEAGAYVGVWWFPG